MGNKQRASVNANRGMATDEQQRALTAEANGAVKDLRAALSDLRRERASILAEAKSVVETEVTAIVKQEIDDTIRKLRVWTDKELGILDHSVKQLEQSLADALGEAQVRFDEETNSIIVSFKEMKFESHEYKTKV